MSGNSEARPVVPLTEPLDASVRVPGSKSYTNRALIAAALAEGVSTIGGALFADDIQAMIESLGRLGIEVSADEAAGRIGVQGCAGELPAGAISLDARLSGTTARFLLPVLALGEGPYLLDGAEPLRRRPMGPSIEALRRLGAEIRELGSPGCLPVEVRGGELGGGEVQVRADLSSQFVSGLLLAAPAMPAGLELEMVGEAVSRPYHEMTVATMAGFGVAVHRPGPGRFEVAPQRYRAGSFEVEPDASAASYFFAAAALCGGRVRVEGLGRRSLQGDLGFVEVLASMGADVEVAEDWTEVRGGALRGVDVDLADMPDMALTFAAVAAFAEGESRVRGVEVIRHHETDRIRAVVTELARCGISATETEDGFVIRPGAAAPARVRTYDDHRMAMSFTVLGLRAGGVEIEDPSCVAKTFPGFFEEVERLRVLPSGGRVQQR